jgi:hypothetical protein
MTHQRDEHRGDDERRRIDDEHRPEGRADARERAGRAHSDDSGHDARQLRQRVRGEEAVGGQELGDERRPRRTEERADRRLDDREGVQEPEPVRSGHGEEPEDDDGPRQVGRDHHAPPVPALDQHAGEEPDNELGRRDRDRRRRDRPGRAGQPLRGQQQRE